MSPSILTILPSEIIDNTIDILAIDDRLSTGNNPFHLPNIKACALTCRAFLPRSRHHIFSRIKIHEAERYIPRYPPENPPCALASAFGKLLTRSPHLAAYTREVYYVFPELGGCLPSVPSAVQTLTRLETLALYSDNGGTLEWCGMNMNPRSRSIFLHLIHLPSITSLKFGSILYFPPSILFPCVNLQRLYFDQVSFDEYDGARPVKGTLSKPIKLQELELLRMDRSVHETMSTILNKTTMEGTPIFDLSGLRKVTVDIQYQDHIQLTSEILTRAQNIRNIHLIFNPPHNFTHHDKVTTDQIIPLLSPSLKTLQSLSLTLNITSTDITTNNNNTNTSLLGDIPRALKIIGSDPTNKIKHLRIDIHLNVSQNQTLHSELDYTAKNDTANTSEWESLGEVFLAPGCWSRLEHVDIGVFVEGGDSDCGNLNELVGARLVFLSRVLESRRLDVVFDFVAADASKVSRTRTRSSGIERVIV